MMASHFTWSGGVCVASATLTGNGADDCKRLASKETCSPPSPRSRIPAFPLARRRTASRSGSVLVGWKAGCLGPKGEWNAGKGEKGPRGWDAKVVNSPKKAGLRSDRSKGAWVLFLAPVLACPATARGAESAASELDNPAGLGAKSSTLGVRPNDAALLTT